jgi:hypothetical protein
MDRNTILTAAFSDAHREDLQATYADRFMLEAESLIRKRLEFYYQESTLQDTNRVTPTGAVYNLPARDIAIVRHILRSDGVPLDQTDETMVDTYSGLNQVVLFAVRPATVIFAATPAVGDTFTLQYFGPPLPLTNPGDSNNLLNDYSDLYKEAIMVSIFKRAQNMDMASAMFQSANSTIDEINRKMKKLLGGARSSNPYNTTWRSSY